MNKHELAKKINAKLDEDGNIKLEDLAEVILQPNSPKKIVDKFVQYADDFALAENLYDEIQQITYDIDELKQKLTKKQDLLSLKYKHLNSISSELRKRNSSV